MIYMYKSLSDHSTSRLVAMVHWPPGADTQCRIRPLVVSELPRPTSWVLPVPPFPPPTSTASWPISHGHPLSTTGRPWSGLGKMLWWAPTAGQAKGSLPCMISGTEPLVYLYFVSLSQINFFFNGEESTKLSMNMTSKAVIFVLRDSLFQELWKDIIQKRTSTS